MVTWEGYSQEVEIFNQTQLEIPPVTAAQLSIATKTDPELSKVYQFVTKGWPHRVAPQLRACGEELFTMSVCQVRTSMTTLHPWIWPS